MCFHSFKPLLMFRFNQTSTSINNGLELHGSQTFVVTACNEVVNLSNVRTAEVEFQIYDREAMHGAVTCLATVGSLLAIGYSSGTILVYNLEVRLTDKETQGKFSASPFELAHQFSFHKSAVTCMIFSGEGGTQLISGSADTYIVIYDLVASTAEFKLMGHSESIT